MRELLTKSRWRAVAFTAFIALVWMNHSIGGDEFDELRERTFAAPREHVFDYVRFPLLFLYRRAADERLYFETASAILGREYDPEIFARRGDNPLPPVTVPVDGKLHLPYAEVPSEYPPPNVPFMIAPRLVTTRFTTYAYVFGGLMGLLLIAAAILATRLGNAGNAASRVTDDDQEEARDQARRIVAFGLLLLAHGGLAIQRLDAVVALLVMLMVRAAVRGDDRGLGFWGGLVGAAKLVPILLLPVLVLTCGIRDARRLGVVALGATVGLALGLGPMLVLGRETLPLLLAYHSARGLHVESSLGILYGAIKAAAGMHEGATLDYGSFNFHGPTSHLLAKLGFALTFVLAGLVAWAAERGRRLAAAAESTPASARTERTERIVLAALATLTALWLGGKVFSPQYLTWALPLAIAVPSKSWTRIAFGFGLVLTISQIYLRGYYDYVVDQRLLGIVTMLVRQGLLVALFVVALKRLGRWTTWPSGATPPSA